MNREMDKYHLMSKDKSSEIHIGQSMIRTRDYKKLLRIQINSKVYF